MNNDFPWTPTSFRPSNTTGLTDEQTQKAGDLVAALHTTITEVVSLSTLVQQALSVLLDVAKAEGYSR